MPQFDGWRRGTWRGEQSGYYAEKEVSAVALGMVERTHAAVAGSVGIEL